MDIKELESRLLEIDSQKVSLLNDILDVYDEVIIIGNGGSNSIASHISQDYTKIKGKRSISFSDPSRLTCYINDFGMENAYSKFLEHFATNGHLVILISSSGESLNILNAAQYCLENDIPMITLSGFSKENSLRQKFGPQSHIHFWVNSSDYGVVECIHQIILHTPV
jgi:D-sedoheptulose 7-phosphate isomerase